MENIRNFVIISHIDHGKSTLADRFLELTETVPKNKMRPQYLDMMDLERERGITIKMQPVRMNYFFEGKEYVLNLIDTPGHVDFSYEVSRSLAAVEGAILLVDASKGIQAQTVANLEQAKAQKLKIVPVLNKIDLPQAQIEESAKEVSGLLEVEEKEILKISAKYGQGVKGLIEEVIKRVPPPRQDQERNKFLRALIFDLKYDPFKGVIAFVRIFGGEVGEGDKIYLLQNKISGKVKEVGYFRPHLLSEEKLEAGDIGYIATGIKESGKVRVGDTICLERFKSETMAFPGYKEPKPMIFASFYPKRPQDFDLLKEALAKIKLTDPSLTFEPEAKEGLGRGFRLGFLGNLHAEIISERIGREEKLEIVVSTPSVLYK
ncbi:MAG TPA: GTP-binding protein, partial [Candidatus Parcubacteria bacterium]|nr:GTP-binding protein [Candidatus Parcubacteria bacterium]